MTSPLPVQLSSTPTGFVAETRGLCKRYGKHIALHNVCMQVPREAVYLLVGPNGAGKSTIIKILLDLARANSGVAEVFGLDPRRQGPLVRANIGYVPEHPAWGYGWMRVGQLLQHHAQYFSTWDSAYAARLSGAFQLRLDQKMSVLSKGQVRRVHLTLALAHRPPLLVLDEPMDGLDPVMRDETMGLLMDHLAETPTTMVISTHHIEEMERFADHIGILRNGELQAQVSAETLQRELRSYRVEIPEGWGGVPELNGAVLRRVDAAREVQWIVWGSEREVVQQFVRSYATVREVRALTLGDATLAMLNYKGSRT